MKRASISETKNRLSALLDHVRQGQTIIIEDRGVPVARLEPVAAISEPGDGRLARLERHGIIRRPRRRLPRAIYDTPPPPPAEGRPPSDLIIEERRLGR